MSRATTLSKVFGQNVQKHRMLLNISQEDLAFRAGLHRTYIGMVERAEKSISLVNAKKIADALGVNLGLLVEDGEEATKHDSVSSQF